jgi:hypothetical protein
MVRDFEDYFSLIDTIQQFISICNFDQHQYMKFVNDASSIANHSSSHNNPNGSLSPQAPSDCASIMNKIMKLNPKEFDIPISYDRLIIELKKVKEIIDGKYRKSNQENAKSHSRKIYNLEKLIEDFDSCRNYLNSLGQDFVSITKTNDQILLKGHNIERHIAELETDLAEKMCYLERLEVYLKKLNFTL